MLTVIYDPKDGLAYADGLIESFVDGVLENAKGKDSSVRIGNEIAIALIRLRIMQGKLNHKEIQFDFEELERRMVADKFGNLDSWPPGFCDYTEKIFLELAGWGPTSTQERP